MWGDLFMISKYKKTIAMSIALICVIMVSLFGVTKIAQKSKLTSALPQNNKLCVIIDAGHGGMDGGAVGVDGIVEKDINLSIALKLKDMMELNGIDVIMTRNTDISIHDEELTSTREQKVSDIHNRLALADENPNAIFISIHQNKFEKASSSGAQVFYSPNNPESASLAQAMQRTIKEAIQQENEREIKQSGSNLYILHNTKNTAIMVECGFLSNASDAALLTDDEYQSKMAYSIFAGLVRYFAV